MPSPSNSRSVSPAPAAKPTLANGKQDKEDTPETAQVKDTQPDDDNSDSSEENGGEEDKEEASEGTGEDKQSTPQHETTDPSADELASAVRPVGMHQQGDWQAIWSPQHNSYYFYNSRSGETTWTNPLADTSTSTATASTSTSTAHDPVAAALAAGIDPELAFLDPSLALPSLTSEAGAFQAKFNARTGAFTKMDARDPSHLSEFERAKRMSGVYFDTDAYEREVQRRKIVEEEEAGKKKKKVTKKDLEKFKEQKRQRKIAKTAWLRT